jgi:hypothetical protein
VECGREENRTLRVIGHLNGLTGQDLNLGENLLCASTSMDSKSYHVDSSSSK